MSTSPPRTAGHAARPPATPHDTGHSLAVQSRL